MPKPALTTEGDGKAVAPEAADLVPRRADLLIEYIAGAAQSFDAYARSLPPWQDLLTRDFPDVYERMLLDPVVHASTRVIKLNVLADDITPRPAVDDADKPDFELAKELADFCADAQGGMKRALEDVWYEHLDGVFVGHRLSEKVLRTQDSGPHSGKSVWDRINPKPQDNYRFVLDPFGNLVGIVTRPPGGDWGPPGSGLVGRDNPNLLPREKFALITWDPHNGDPRGRALLRHVYEPWWHKQQALSQWLKFLAQTAVPSLFATTPQGAGVLPPQDALGNSTGAQALSPGQQLLNQLVAFQGGTAMVAAAGTLLQVIQAAGDGSVFSRRIDYADSCIAREITLQTLAIIEAKHGTRSQGEVHQDVMDLGVDYIRRLSCRVIREDVYRPLIRYNWGDDAADRLCPFASMTAVAKQDLNTTLPAYASVGYQLAPDQLPAVDEELGLPVRKEQPPEQQPPPGDGNQPGNPPDGNQPPGGPDAGLSKSTVPPAVPFSEDAPFYDPDQPRDDDGKWAGGGGGRYERFARAEAQARRDVQQARSRVEDYPALHAAAAVLGKVYEAAAPIPSAADMKLVLNPGRTGETARAEVLTRAGRQLQSFAESAAGVVGDRTARAVAGGLKGGLREFADALASTVSGAVEEALGQLKDEGIGAGRRGRVLSSLRDGLAGLGDHNLLSAFDDAFGSADDFAREADDILREADYPLDVRGLYDAPAAGDAYRVLQSHGIREVNPPAPGEDVETYADRAEQAALVPRRARAARELYGLLRQAFLSRQGPGRPDAGLSISTVPPAAFASPPFPIPWDELSGLSREELLSLLADAALQSRLSIPADGSPDAPFYSPDQLRDEQGRWTSGGGGLSPAEHERNRSAAADAVRAFAGGTRPATEEEVRTLAGHLARLTVAQLHALKAEHGLRASAPDKAALVQKLAQRFTSHRQNKQQEGLTAHHEESKIPVGSETRQPQERAMGVFLKRQPGESALDFLRRFAADPGAAEKWGDVATVIHSLSRDQVEEAEKIIGVDPAKRDRTYPTTHVFGAARDRFEAATAERGRAERAERARKLLAEAATTDDPKSVQRAWDDLTTDFSLSGRQKELLALDLGIRHEPGMAPAALMNAIRDAIKPAAQAGEASRAKARVQSLYAKPRDFGLTKRDLPKTPPPDSSVWSTDVQQDFRSGGFTGRQKGDAVTIQGVEHTVLAAGSVQRLRDPELGTLGYRQYLLVRPATGDESLARKAEAARQRWQDRTRPFDDYHLSGYQTEEQRREAEEWLREYGKNPTAAYRREQSGGRP